MHRTVTHLAICHFLTYLFMATPLVYVAGTSEMDTGQESTSAEEPMAVDEQASDTSEEAVKVRKPKKATSKKEKQQPEKSEKREKRHRSLRLLQHQHMKENELRAARLIRCRWYSFSIYFPKVLRVVHVDLTLSQRSVSILDSFIKDMFERIAMEASNLAHLNKSATINSREIQTAVRLLLTGKMCEQAIAEGTMALVRYISTK